MPACCVPNCCNGYNYKKDVEAAAARGVTLSFFQVKQSQVEKWNRAIPRKDKTISTSDYVCSEHFYESDIKRFDDDIIVDGKIIEKGRKLRQPRLLPDAIPKIFNGPSYLTKPETKKRVASRDRASTPIRKRCKNDKENEDSIVSPSDAQQEQVILKQILKSNLMQKLNQTTPPASLVETTTNVPREDAGQLGDIAEMATTDQENNNKPQIEPGKVKLPGFGWGWHAYPSSDVFVKINEKCTTVTHWVEIAEGKASVKIRGCLYPQSFTINSNSDIEEALLAIDKINVCGGNGHCGYSKKCIGGVKKGIRCNACRASGRYERKKKMRAARTQKIPKKKINIQRSKKMYYLKKQNEALKKKVKALEAELKNLYEINKKLEKGQVEKAIQSLPPGQQQAVIACLEAAKREGPHGNRYHIEWIYECLLMRIKSPSLYEHIRTQNVLALPCRTTLNRYMRHLKPVYGFQRVLFEVLKQKISGWPETDVHGGIVVDEMKIPSELDFDRHTLKAIGLTDLGDYTPEEEKNEAGDHILVVMFRPYRGDWYQTLGLFLAKGNAKGPILSKIILEAIGLAEGAGLKVDSISTDAAGWNRNMWTVFGIDENSCSMEHPQDESRQLFFFSDWSHIVKCARNMLCPELPPKKPTTAQKKQPKKQYDENGQEMTPQEIYEKKLHAALNKEIEVPEGMVKRRHWIALLREEEDLANRQGVAALTYVPGLSRKTVFPDGFERMNVAMARKFFSNSARAGMEFHRKNAVEDFEDSEPTERFIHRFNELCDVMNSHGPVDAVRAENDKLEIISNYLEYHKECVELAKKKGKAFLSKETDLGITVTLKSTIGLSKYLLNTVGYKYVMTSRFNSDIIEQFFSKLRAAGKANSTPNPKLAAQLYRLLCVYSLIKPPKGSNVEGGENVKALMNAEDPLEEMEQSRQQEISDLLDEIVTNGEVDDYAMPHMMDHSYLASPEQCEENILSFMAGFTSFRQKKIAGGCEDCILTFSKPRQEAGSSFTFTRIKEIYMGYTIPSDAMVAVVSAVESAVRESMQNHGVQTEMFKTTLKYIKLDTDNTVGCIQHKEEMTKKIIKFYLTMRMFFVINRRNQQIELERRKQEQKKLVKRARLL